MHDFETRGIEFRCASEHELSMTRQQTEKYLRRHHLLDAVKVVEKKEGANVVLAFFLNEEYKDRWAPDWDTTHLSETLSLRQKTQADALDYEIIVAMLLATIPFVFPNYEELASAIRIRHFVVSAGYRAALNFDVDAVERPEEFWHYDEEAGFLLNPGKSIIAALIAATQPDDISKAYSFSCYRATEYVILLSIAQELAITNPELLKRLEERSQRRAIRSGEFHEVFLKEYGSIEDPFPMRYYVPGDRVWFRNPDSRSSDISGYEGSWVIYLGNNLFTNFWKRDQPFSLEAKCVEVFHWKDGAYQADDGELKMDEDVVEACVIKTLADESVRSAVIERMMRYRDPKGVYESGGCIDTSRESPRWVGRTTTDIHIPD
jgi:hypothetical protein